MKGNVEIKYCPTGEMIGDFMTKPKQGREFKRFRNDIMGFNWFKLLVVFNYESFPPMELLHMCGGSLFEILCYLICFVDATTGVCWVETIIYCEEWMTWVTNIFLLTKGYILSGNDTGYD